MTVKDLVIKYKKEHFAYYNANPAKKETNDCVVRAICTAYGKGWTDVNDELHEIAKSTFSVFNDKEVYETYLKNNDAVYIKTMQKYKRITTGEFAEIYKTGIYILRLAHHLTICIDSVILDTWDCSTKTVYCAYEIK